MQQKIVKVSEKSKYSDYVVILAYIADICNYNCTYCYNKKPRSGKFLDLDALLDACLAIYQSTHKKIKLELIGGEPTMHPKLM